LALELHELLSPVRQGVYTGHTMQDESDDRLLAAAKGGDRAALLQLLERHQAQIYRFGMCGDAQDAQDVLQDTLLAMARGVPDFRQDASISSWLYAIARSFCSKKHRKSKFAPTQHSSLSDHEGDNQKLAAPGDAPDDAVAVRQLRDALQRAIDSLEPSYREVLILRDVEGLTAMEVAQALGLGVPAVKSRLHRARRELREQLMPYVNPREAEVAPSSGCPDVLRLFSEHLEDDLDPRLCGEMQRHLQGCSRCSQTCDSLRAMLDLCHSSPKQAVPEAVQSRVREAVQQLLAEQTRQP
jgi:RNA polymerase sigma-70 factor (ECF subfamily)